MKCIGNKDLEKCHVCGKDPMDGWESTKHARLRPFDQAEPPSLVELRKFSCFYGQVLSCREDVEHTETVEFKVECANRSLELFKDMISATICTMTRNWSQKLNVYNLQVSATLLDGSVLQEKRVNVGANCSQISIRKIITEWVCESFIGFAGARDKCFSASNIGGYKLDQIVEVTIQFCCKQWTYDFFSLNKERPYELSKNRRTLGNWHCFACLSGLARAYITKEVPAKRFIVKEI